MRETKLKVGDTVTIEKYMNSWHSAMGSPPKDIEYPFTGVVEEIKYYKADDEYGFRVSGYGFAWESTYESVMTIHQRETVIQNNYQIW